MRMQGFCILLAAACLSLSGPPERVRLRLMWNPAPFYVSEPTYIVRWGPSASNLTCEAETKSIVFGTNFVPGARYYAAVAARYEKMLPERYWFATMAPTNTISFVAPVMGRRGAVW